jgi:hypothetical protein
MSLFVLSSRDGWVNIMYTGLDAVGVDQQVSTCLPALTLKVMSLPHTLAESLVTHPGYGCCLFQYNKMQQLKLQRKNYTHILKLWILSKLCWTAREIKGDIPSIGMGLKEIEIKVNLFDSRKTGNGYLNAIKKSYHIACEYS